VKPLILEWERGSNAIGDFSWPGFGDNVAVTTRVREELAHRFRGFEFGPVEIESTRTSGQRQTDRSHDAEAQLCELWVTTNVGMDPERSSAWLVKRCGACGREEYMLEDVEREQTEWDADSKQLVRHRFRRRPGRGLYIGERTLDGASIFHVREFPAWILCTDPVKQSIEMKGFTNVAFFESGETF